MRYIGESRCWMYQSLEDHVLYDESRCRWDRGAPFNMKYERSIHEPRHNDWSGWCFSKESLPRVGSCLTKSRRPGIAKIERVADVAFSIDIVVTGARSIGCARPMLHWQHKYSHAHAPKKKRQNIYIVNNHEYMRGINFWWHMVPRSIKIRCARLYAERVSYIAALCDNWNPPSDPHNRTKPRSLVGPNRHGDRVWWSLS